MYIGSFGLLSALSDLVLEVAQPQATSHKPHGSNALLARNQKPNNEPLLLADGLDEAVGVCHEVHQHRCRESPLHPAQEAQPARCTKQRKERVSVVLRSEVRDSDSIADNAVSACNSIWRYVSLCQGHRGGNAGQPCQTASSWEDRVAAIAARSPYFG